MGLGSLEAMEISTSGQLVSGDFRLNPALSQIT